MATKTSASFNRLPSGFKGIGIMPTIALVVLFSLYTIIFVLVELITGKSFAVQFNEMVSGIQMFFSATITVDLPMWAFLAITLGLLFIGAKIGSNQARIGRF